MEYISLNGLSGGGGAEQIGKRRFSLSGRGLSDPRHVSLLLRSL